MKEHLETTVVNTLIFLLLESYSDGKLFEIGNTQQPLQLKSDFTWGLCITEVKSVQVKVKTKLSQTFTLLLLFILTVVCL